MLADDTLGELGADRLGSARDALVDLSNTMVRVGGHRLGLVVFASRARLICPLTHDYAFFRDAVAGLDPEDASLEIGPGPGLTSGTRIGAGILQAVQAQEPDFAGYQNIVLLSDGDDPAHDGEWLTGVAAAKDAGIPVDTVGIGDPDKASPIPIGPGRVLKHEGQAVLTRLEERPLEEIARRTGGVYISGRTKTIPLGGLMQERLERLAGQEHAALLPGRAQHSALFFAVALLLLGLDMLVAERRQSSEVTRRFGPSLALRAGTAFP